MNYTEMFKASVNNFPNSRAVADFDCARYFTYKELDSLSGRIAGKIRSLGIPEGSFILICM